MSVLAVSCGNNVEDFFHILAKAVVYNTNDVDQIKRIRVNITYEACEDLTPAISCGDVSDPLELLKKTAYIDCDDIVTVNLSLPPV